MKGSLERFLFVWFRFVLFCFLFSLIAVQEKRHCKMTDRLSKCEVN